MEQGNASVSASSNSVGMMSTKCAANMSKSDQDCTVLSQAEENDLASQQKEQPTKKQKIFKEYSEKFGKNSGLVENSRSGSGGIVGSSVGREWLGGFQDFVASSNLAEQTRKSELDEYLKEGLFPMDNETEFDILHWWKHNGPKFPILARMAQDILAIPTSSVASENSFSKCRRIITDTRSSLSYESVETLMCVKDWLPDLKDGKSEKVVEDGSSMMCDLSYSDWDLDF